MTTSLFNVSLNLTEKNEIFFNIKNEGSQDYYVCSFHNPLEAPKGVQLTMVDSNGKKAIYNGKLVSRIHHSEAHSSWILISKGETVSKKCDLDYYDMIKGSTYDVSLTAKDIIYAEKVIKGVKIEYKTENIKCNSLKFKFS